MQRKSSPGQCAEGSASEEAPEFFAANGGAVEQRGCHDRQRQPIENGQRPTPQEVRQPRVWHDGKKQCRGAEEHGSCSAEDWLGPVLEHRETKVDRFPGSAPAQLDLDAFSVHRHALRSRGRAAS